MVNGKTHHMMSTLPPPISPLTPDGLFLRRVFELHGEAVWANLAGLYNVLALPKLRCGARRSDGLDERRVHVEVELEPGNWETVHSIRFETESVNSVALWRGSQSWAFEPDKLPRWRSESNSRTVTP